MRRDGPSIAGPVTEEREWSVDWEDPQSATEAYKKVREK
jgi:hypothetical protein